MVLHKPKGTIQKGLFFGGVGLQVYAPGQSCKWKILVRGAKSITLYFETVALTYDELDFIKVGHENDVQETLTGFGKNITVTVFGDEANIHFNSYGGKSPQPESAGFILHYAAGKYSETLMPIVYVSSSVFKVRYPGLIRLLTLIAVGVSARTPLRDGIVC